MLQSGSLLPITIPTISNPASTQPLLFHNTSTTTSILPNTAGIDTVTASGKGPLTGMNIMSDAMLDDDDDIDSMGDDDDDKGDGSKRNKSRRELPGGAVATLKAWLLSPEHFTHPYPTPQDQAMLMAKTGIDKKQLKNWFTNARRRIWKPMLKKQIEAGKLSAAGGGVVTTTGGMQLVTMPVGNTATGFPNLSNATTAGGTLVHGTPALTGTSAIDNPHSVQAMRAHYQQAIQEQNQYTNLSTDMQQQIPQQQQTVTISLDAYGNPVYAVPMPAAASGDTSQPTQTIQYYTISTADVQQQQQQHQQQQQPIQQQHQQQQFSVNANPAAPASVDNQVQFSAPPEGQQQQQQLMSKADSHAVLMELFFRDQDLVRQATESARLKAESKQQQMQMANHQQNLNGKHPNSQQQSVTTAFQQGQSQSLITSSPGSQQAVAKMPSAVSTSFISNPLQSVPSLNSWPHFSSITSLNNLGSMPGVRSISSLSGADLASKGSLSKMGNIAQVKSVESMMGRNDSYAFLEVFFCDRSSNNLLGMGGGNNAGSNGYGTGTGSQKGLQDASEENDIGLPLEDESPMHSIKKEYNPGMTGSTYVSTAANGPGKVVPIQPQQHDVESSGNSVIRGHMDSGGTLKRAYDDAMAARGLMSVSRSSEKLTDLVLPEKIQRTLSQEFNKGQQQQRHAANAHQTTQGTPYVPYAAEVESNSSQYPGQQPTEPSGGNNPKSSAEIVNGTAMNNTSNSNKVSVHVAACARCELCHEPNVDTQTRPCGHMFHDSCLKSTFRNLPFQLLPICPLDTIPISSIVIAVPDPNAPELR